MPGAIQELILRIRARFSPFHPPLLQIAVATSTILLILLAYLDDLGRNPYGFFCDEAEIAVRARQLLDGNPAVDRFSFFYHHFDAICGSVTIFATAPFIWLFGLNEFAVRFTSVAFMLATFVVLWLTFRLLKCSHPWLPVLIYALTPLTLHISRVNFGHAPSIFLIALGYYLYLRSQSASNLPLAVAGGAVIGLSAYGYPGFYAATAIFVALVVGCEVIAAGFNRRQLQVPVMFGLAAFVMYLPIIQEYRTNPAFLARFNAKDPTGEGLFTFARLESMIHNFPKYYDFEFLFETGDTSAIVRHSVHGAGLLSLPVLPLIVIGTLTFAFSRNTVEKRAFSPFIALLIFAPVPDLLTTQTDQQPYTFSLFTASLLVPFVCAYGLETLHTFHQHLEHKAPGEDPATPNPFAPILRNISSAPFITTIVMFFGLVFAFAIYPRYPDYSSGFWGWQAGPRDSIAYFLDHQDEYDEFYLQGEFNTPDPFLPFYIHDEEVLKRAHIGDQYDYRPGVRQLFVVSEQNYSQNIDPSLWNVVTTITYPDDTIAFYLIAHK